MRNDILNIRITRTFAVLIVAACVIFESCYALQTVDDFSFLDFPLLSLTIVLLASRKNESCPSDILRWGFIAVLAFVLSSVLINFSQLTVVNSVKIILVLVASYLVAIKFNIGNFLSACIRVLKVVTVFALILWILTNLLGFSLPLPEVVNRNGVAYQSGVVVFQFAHYAKTTPAIGIFWEGGVFSSFLLIAIALWASRIIEFSKRTLVIFILGIVASGSTAGFLMLPLALAPRFFVTRSRVRLIALIVFLVVVLLMLYNLDYILVFLYELNPDLFGKVVNLNQLTTSTRLNSPLANLQIFFESPIFGKGMGNAAIEYASIVSESSSIDSQTSTSTFLMAAFGLGGILVNVLWLIALLRQKDLTIEQRIILVVLFALILNKETHYLTMVMYCLLMLFLKRSGPLARISKGRV